MHPINPSYSPRANIANPIANVASNAVHEAQAPLPPIAENPGNLPLNASPRSEPRAVQIAAQNERKALKPDSNFLKALMALPKELQYAIFKHINTLEDCETVFQGLKEGVEIIEASELDPADKEAEIKKLKSFLNTVLRASRIEELDLKEVQAIERLKTISTFLGNIIKFEGLGKLVVSVDSISVISALIEFYGKSATIYMNGIRPKLPDIRPLASYKSKHMKSKGKFHWLKLRLKPSYSKGLEGCSKLSELTLSRYPCLADIHGLTGLMDLRELCLRECNQIGITICALSGLTNLQKLSLSNCIYITDIHVLSSLTNLQMLDLNGCNQLRDVRPLSGLTNLQRLSLSNCTHLTDTNVLASLTNLQMLDLSHCSQLTDIHALSGLTNLQGLYLTYCHQITEINISILKELPNLTEVDIHGTAIDWLQLSDDIRRAIPIM